MDELYLCRIDEIEILRVENADPLLGGEFALYPLAALDYAGEFRREEWKSGSSGTGHEVSGSLLDSFMCIFGVSKLSQCRGKWCYAVLRGGIIKEFHRLTPGPDSSLVLSEVVAAAKKVEHHERFVKAQRDEERS
jgi:hypothetical protein